jgi:predicted transcriptional regulator
MINERLSLYNGYAREFSIKLAEYLSDLVEKLAETAFSNKSNVPKKAIDISGTYELQKRMWIYLNLLKWLKSFDIRKHQDVEMVKYSL